MSDPGLAPASKRSLSLLVIVVTTGVVAWLAYGLRYAPVIYSDDWSHVVGQYVHGTLQWLDLSNRRPLLDAPLLVLTGLFGINIGALHFVIIVLHVLASLQLYWLLRRIGAGRRSFALGVSLLFLVYPADYTHMWLTMVGAWVVMNLLLAYAHLLLAYVTTGAIWLLVASCSLLIASLGIYEAQLGLALAWPLLLLWVGRDAPRTRKIALLAPVAIGLLFAAWRSLGMPANGVTDPYIQQIQFSPLLLVDRVWLGLKVVLAWSWAVPLFRGLGMQSNWLAWGIIAVLVFLCWLVVAVLNRLSAVKHESRDPDALKDVRRGVAMVGIGLAFTIAGYLPFVTLLEPNLSGVSSRVNLFATIGASVLIVSVISAASWFFSRSQDRMANLTLAGLVPLVILGIATQAWVQYDSRVAWAEQKDIWDSLFILAPDFKQDSVIYIILPGYQERQGWANWRRTPFDASWEITAGLQVLYGNRSLHGDLFLPDGNRRIGKPKLTEKGIVDYWSGQLTPFSNAVFFTYEGTPRKLHLVNNLNQEFSQFLSWQPQDYVPGMRILAQPTNSSGLRRLVAVEHPDQRSKQ